MVRARTLYTICVSLKLAETEMADSEDQLALREQIIEQCLWMNSSGLNQGTSGNISVRYKDTMLITPSGIPYGQLKPDDIAAMSLKHDRFEWEGPCKPSSEWHFHRAILQSQPSYGAIVHTHSTYATVLSMANTKIPACHYMIAAFGGNTVRCSKYATFGTPKLSTNILKAMKNRSACLMANHGMVVAGTTLSKAMWAAVELETLSKQYYLASRLDNMVVLPNKEMDRVVKKFANYGQKDKNSESGSAESINGDGSGIDENSEPSQAQSDERVQLADSYNRPSKTQPNIKLPTNKN